MNKREIIEFWYKKLGFPEKYDEEFYRALEEIEISDESTIENYDMEEQDGKKNLLSYLYFCEDLKEKYINKNIDLKILYDTMKDIVIWTDIWSGIKGELYLGEIAWLKRYYEMRLFKLGRLEFCMGKVQHDIPSENILKGDSVLEIHIPATGALKNQLCQASIEEAKAFFAKHFPEFEYKCFTCHSWLLDTSLKEILKDNSNIIQFQSMFEIVFEEKSDAILKYVFKWDMTRNDLSDIPCVTGFAEKIKERILSGKDFYESLGIIRK